MRQRDHGRATPTRGHGRRASALLLLLAGVCVVILAGCGSSSSGTPYGRDGSGAPFDGAIFQVVDTAGLPVVGAMVWLVPATAVDTAPFDGQDVLDGTAETRDEPLEDAIALKGAGMPRGLTGPDGRARIEKVPPGTYFRFVAPAASDTEHLPGGSGCLLAVASTVFTGRTTTLTVSSSPPAGTRYLGTTACVGCHPAYITEREHAHKLGFSVPGRFTSLQDPVRYPDFEGNWDRFLPGAAHTAGTVVYFSDYDAGRGFDKFKTSLTDPSPGGTVYVKAYLWRDTNDANKFKVTLENVINAGDPNSPWTFEVALTYGGAVYKQRNLLRLPGRKGLYPFLQWQSEGDESSIDRTRKVFRDYHLDWYWDDAGQLLTLPAPTRNFEGNCAGCHFTGFRRFQDPVTTEWLADAVNDGNGAYDIDGDGARDEINVGCESCHGPGTAHGAWAFDPANASRAARYIVTPENLSPSRQIMICGRCHDRPRGNGTVATDEPLNASNEMPPVGVSRAEYLASYVSRNGPPAGAYWSDLLHSKSHRQQYADFLKSTMHRNDRYLTVCSDCHDSHGYAPFRHHLKEDPDAVDSFLCLNCHGVIDIGTHTADMVGFNHVVFGGVVLASCVDCHQPKTAKTGAGRYGRILLSPPMTPAHAYFENDITSHLFVVPRKTHPDVAGVTPGAAMPIPYTNSCGLCHNVSNLKPSWLASLLGEAPGAHDVDDYAAD